MTGIIYCRVSSKEQIEGTSLESQELACREYAQAHGITILKIFVERGESAKFADRTQLIDLLNFCRDHKGQVETLLVWKVDRFARNVGDHFNIKAQLLKYGVRVVSVTEPIDSNPEGRLLETILAGFAQFDNDIRAMRTVQGMRRKLQEGIFPWAPPLGYKSADPGGRKIEPDVPDQPLFGLLQRAWREFATGAYTKADIRRLMASWGIVTHKGLPLGPQSIDKLFRNLYYAGRFVNPWTGEEMEGRHIPMVSPTDFARVYLLLSKSDRRAPHRKFRPDFPLRGVVRCPKCLQYMSGSNSRGRSMCYAYYHCFRTSCPRTSYAVGCVHDEFYGFLRATSAKPQLVSSLTGVILKTAENRRSMGTAQQSRRKESREQLKRQMTELIRMRTTQLISDAEFVKHKRTLDDKAMAFDAAAGPCINLDQLQRDMSEITEPLCNLKEAWDSMRPPRRRRFERLLLPVGFVYGKIRTAEMGHIFRVSGDFSSKDASLVPLGDEALNHILHEIAEFAALLRSDPSDDNGREYAVRSLSGK